MIILTSARFIVVVLMFSSSRVIAEGFHVELGEPSTVPDSAPGVPIYRWCPDGHIPVLSDEHGLQMFWAGPSSYRTVGLSIDEMRLSPLAPLIAKGDTVESFDNGGAWLYSVFAISKSQYLGFYHAEDHEWQMGRSTQGVAWKSIALCTSDDGGETWHKKGQILTTSRKRPIDPTWGGCGDHCVVFDKNSSRWFCFYQEHYLYMAVSEDKQALPGTWKKWHGDGFEEPGLGGRGSRIPPLETHPGGNPSVHFNTELNCWFMVWHTWTGNLVYSSSRDLVQWEPPVDLLTSNPNEKAWYPTIIGVSDTLAGREATFFYGHWPDKKKRERHFIRRPIRFVVDSK